MSYRSATNKEEAQGAVVLRKRHVSSPLNTLFEHRSTSKPMMDSDCIRRTGYIQSQAASTIIRVSQSMNGFTE